MGNPQSVNGSVPRERRQRQNSPQALHPVRDPLEAALPSPLRPSLPPRTSPLMVSMRLWVAVGGAWWSPGKARMKSDAELRVELSLVRDLSGASSQRRDWGALPSAGIGGQSKAEGREAGRDLRNKS